jgi:segregation and condensation protein B
MNLKTNYLQVIEGLLFLSGSNGITMGELIAILNLDQTKIANHIKKLNKNLTENKSALTIIETAQTYKLVTTNLNGEFYRQYAELEFNDKLSNSALETLAIIAYNQPITRFDIEDKRGVMASHHIKTLVSRDLVKIVGKANEIGRPNIYGTTSQFLDYIGVNSLEQLPSLEEFRLNITNEEESDLFSEVDDFKEIKKRLLTSSNIIKIDHQLELEDIDSIEIKDVILNMDEEEENHGETTESNS